MTRSRHENTCLICIIDVFAQLLVAAVLDEASVGVLIGLFGAASELGHGLLVLGQENVKLISLVDGQIVTLIVAAIVGCP